MSQPPAYNREADFTKNHGSVQNDSLLNSELDDVSQSINALRERQALLLKDDDTLVNNIVTKDSLNASLQDSFNQIAVAVSTADNAKTIASEANATASEANATASEANTTAQNAETHALTVEKTVNETIANIEESTKAASLAAEAAETAANNAAESASGAKTEASAASTTASTALENARTALSKGLEAVTKAQTAVDTVEELQTNLPSQVETEVTKQVDDAFEGKVTAAVEKAAPAIVENIAASKDYVDSSVSTEATARSSADATLQQNIDNIGDNLATVATSGSYNDLSNKPAKLSDFSDDLGSSPTHTHSQYLTEHQSLADYAKTSQLSDYLPLSGGTMTGDILFDGAQGLQTSVADGYVHLRRSGTKANGFAYSIVHTKSDGTNVFNELWREDEDGLPLEHIAESGTNYIRYKSGLQVCWGSTGNYSTAGGSYTNKVFTYAKDFMGAPYVYATFDTGSTSGAFGKCSCSVTDVQSASCSVRFFNGDSTVRQPNIVILAVGRWK